MVRGLNRGERYHVKCIMVEARRSPAEPHHRSEHWIVRGTVAVTKGDAKSLLTENNRHTSQLANVIASRTREGPRFPRSSRTPISVKMTSRDLKTSITAAKRAVASKAELGDNTQTSYDGEAALFVGAREPDWTKPAPTNA